MDEATQRNRSQNRLLSSLAASDYALIQPHLEPVALKYRASLVREGQIIKYVHFIESGVGSLVNTMRNGSSCEVGTIGNEGLVGLPVLFHDDMSPIAVYMQVAGAGLRIKAKIFANILNDNASIRTTMVRYAHAFFNQIAQSAACAHHYNLEQRCCRWLLMTHDRMQSDVFVLTHEFLAMMLGVRRAGVSQVAAVLKERGLIHYRRSAITIVDRAGLEKRSCECYRKSAKEFDRLLGKHHAARHPSITSRATN